VGEISIPVVEALPIPIRPNNRKTSSLFVVLEREPECHMNVSSIVNAGDFIKLQCHINFTGGWLPVLQCFVESRGGQNRTLTLGLKSRVVLFLQCVTFTFRGGG